VVLVQAEEWWILQSVPEEDETLSGEEIVVLDAEAGEQGLILQETSGLEQEGVPYYWVQYSTDM